jgi:hypothetical protein
MFSPGDVVRFFSDTAGKRKFHLCISVIGDYLFINSPKRRTYPSDFVIPCTDIPCIPPTDSGYSIISCSLLISMSDWRLKKLQAQKLGTIDVRILKKLIAFVENSPVLSPGEKNSIIGGLGDWA